MPPVLILDERDAIDAFLDRPTEESYRSLFRAISPRVFGYFRIRGCERGLAERSHSGSTGRNILHGPGVFNLDGSVFRNFKLSERFGLQFRAEMFNVTNTPSFSNPGATVSSMSRNIDGSIKALNGYTEIAGTSSSARYARFAMKISF